MGEGGQSTSLHRCDGKERGSKILYFHPYLVRWSNLTIIFQMGRNHQLAKYVLFFYGLAAGVFMVWWNILIFSSKSVFRTISGTVIAAANQRGFFLTGTTTKAKWYLMWEWIFNKDIQSQCILMLPKTNLHNLLWKWLPKRKESSNRNFQVCYFNSFISQVDWRTLAPPQMVNHYEHLGKTSGIEWIAPLNTHIEKNLPQKHPKNSIREMVGFWVRQQ